MNGKPSCREVYKREFDKISALVGEKKYFSAVFLVHSPVLVLNFRKNTVFWNFFIWESKTRI